MSDLDELRRKRMQELQEQAANAENQEQAHQEIEMQKKQVLMQILTPEARSRLANIRLTKPEFVNQVELQLIQLAQMGRIQSKIDDDQLKELLKKISAPKRKISISRR